MHRDSVLTTTAVALDSVRGGLVLTGNRFISEYDRHDLFIGFISFDDLQLHFIYIRAGQPLVTNVKLVASSSDQNRQTATVIVSGFFRNVIHFGDLPGSCQNMEEFSSQYFVFIAALATDGDCTSPACHGGTHGYF